MVCLVRGANRRHRVEAMKTMRLNCLVGAQNGEWGVGSGEWGQSLESETLPLLDFPVGCCSLNYSSDFAPLLRYFHSPFPIPHSPLPTPHSPLPVFTTSHPWR